MSSGAQVDLDWAGMDAGPDGAPEMEGNVSGAAGAGASSASTTRMTDEDILGMDSVGQTLLSVPESAAAGGGAKDAFGNELDAAAAPQGQTGVSVLQQMPAWMQAVAADPKHAGEAQQLWQEHQAFRAAFSSAEEARAVKELLPGGAQEVLALREAAQEVSSLRQSAASMQEAAQSVDRIDAAIFSGDARAQSEVVAEMARANPAAFRSMFAEAAKVLAGMGAGGREAGGQSASACCPLPERWSVF